MFHRDPLDVKGPAPTVGSTGSFSFTAAAGAVAALGLAGRKRVARAAQD